MGYLYILLAGSFWATVGFFTTNLSNVGLSTEEIGFLRLFIGFLIIATYVTIKNPSLLKISKRGLIYSIVIGLFCQGLFNYCYVSSIKHVGSAVAAVLLYTSPIFLATFSKVIYKEDINKIKLISIGTCFIAAILAATGGDLNLENISIFGIITGILSAILYALLPVISKNILNELNNLTMVIYSFLTGSLFFIAKVDFIKISESITGTFVAINILGLGFFSAALAYICYTLGVKKGVELSVAGVVASIELVLAQVIAWTIMKEPFNIIKIIGVCLMIISAIIALKSVEKSEEDIMETDEEL